MSIYKGKTLQPDVALQYKLKPPLFPGEYILPGGRKVDFRIMNMDEVEQLISEGHDCFEKISSAPQAEEMQQPSRITWPKEEIKKRPSRRNKNKPPIS